MYCKDFVLSLLTRGKVLGEINGKVEIVFDSEFIVRLRNKHRLAALCDIYIDSRKVNENGSYYIEGNSYIDVDAFIGKDGKGNKFLFVKSKDGRVEQMDEPENGIIEARFYLQSKEQMASFTEYLVIEKGYPVYVPSPYWYYEPRPFKTFDVMYGGGELNSSDDISLNNCNYSSSGTLNGNISNSLTTSGATVKGRKTEIDYKPKELNVVQDVTVLKLKLTGKERTKFMVSYCSSCGAKLQTKFLFCPKCGEQR